MKLCYRMFRSLFEYLPVPTCYGEMSREEMTVLLSLCAAYRPKMFVEVGVHLGKTTKGLLMASPWIERYVGVDMEGGDVPEPGVEAKGDPRLEMLILRKGEVLDPARIAGAGMYFIDANHAYEHVKQDTEIVKAAIGGNPAVVAWHDYNFPEVWGGEGVTRYIDECNAVNDRICWVMGTHVCFELVNLKFSVSIG